MGMEHTTICKNCNCTFEGNFCNHCGQPADTHRISLHYIWHDLQHGLFHFDNGLFYTAKQLLTRPGYAVREFIAGKRVRHSKPLAFVVVLATLYGLLYHYFIQNLFKAEHINPTDGLTRVYEKVIHWNLDHLAYAVLILIVSTTIASYQVFKKQGYNPAEHLVLNAYYRGLELVISLLLFPLLFLLQRSGAGSFRYYAFTFQFLDFGLMYWCYAQFFHKLTRMKAFGLTVLTYSFMTVINMTIGYVAAWIASVTS
jgi:Protein of unknown function (DUF3667)